MIGVYAVWICVSVQILIGWLTTGQFFWSFDIRYLLDLVKSYLHIEGMAERLRIHVFDRWLFQKMHSELAALARTCVLGPNRPDVRNYKLCLKSQVKSAFRNAFPEFVAILMGLQSFNHSFTSVTLLTLSRSVVLRWHLGSRADKLWEGADGKHSPETWQTLQAVAPRVRGNSRLGRIYANRCESACFFTTWETKTSSKHFDCLWCARDVFVMCFCVPVAFLYGASCSCASSTCVLFHYFSIYFYSWNHTYVSRGPVCGPHDGSG